MATISFVLPGDRIDSELLPSHPTKALKLGPGLRHLPPDIITPTVAGQLYTDLRKNAAWIEYNGGRYTPAVDDLVIATIHHSSTDVYHASITDYTSYAQLPQLSFEGATKKTRPQLTHGSLVYARISLANKHMDPEIECVSASTGKADGLGPLIGGMIFNVSIGMSRRLLMSKQVENGGVCVLEEFGGTGVAFETAVGRNGKLWVNSKSTKATLAIGNAVQQTDQNRLSLEEQRKLVKKLVREL